MVSCGTKNCKIALATQYYTNRIYGYVKNQIS